MFFNYLKTAYRNLLKAKGFLILNTAGLVVGMTAFILIMFYVQFEKSYERFYPDYNRIYRLRYERITEDGQAVRFASCCPPAGGIIRQRFPEVEKLARMFHYQAIVSHQNTKFLEERMYFVEPDFLEIFPTSIIVGEPAQEIAKPGRAFVSEYIAKKYFGDESAVGKTISVDKQMDFLIIGIFANPPDNSHLKCDILRSFEDFENLFGPEYMLSWGHTLMYTYVRLKTGADLNALEQKLAELVEEQFGEVLRQYNMTMLLPLQPLADIHLTSHFMQELENNGNADVVNFLTLISLFIILIAWVNYINLSTAQSLNRAHEVGLRKVVGATRIQLIYQFFLETAISHTFAILLTVGLVEILTSFFSNLIGLPANIRILSQSWFPPTLLLIFLSGILLSGFYPVLTMTHYQPLLILRGKLGTRNRGIGLRKILVIVQFILALVLITGTIMTYQQIKFMLGQDVGFNRDEMMIVKAPRIRENTYEEKWKTFKQVLLQQTAVQKICQVSEVPGRQILWDAGGIRRAGEDPNKGKNYQIVGIDYDYLDVFSLSLAAGRNFSENFPTDAKALMLNETAVKVMGFANNEAAIGEQVDYWGEIFTIIGVLQNYHQQSLKQEFEPHLYRFAPTGWGNRGHFAIQVRSENFNETIKKIKTEYDSFFPGNPIEYFFLDDYFNQQYKSDQMFGTIIGLFSGLAIFITALGIFGLASFNAVQRTKEIGIRKVMGASVFNILIILIKDFLRLIALAFVFALPVLIIGTHIFLRQYAFRMAVQLWLFFLPLLGITIITLLTVSMQVIKAATSNPVDVLKYE